MNKEIVSTGWLVAAPEGVPFAAALTAACRGKDKTAILLNYFLYLAAQKVKAQKIDPEEVEYIEIKKNLDQIIQGLATQNKAASKKTIHDRIVDLTFDCYISADGYHQTYRVYHKNIAAALLNPPEPAKPKLRGRHVRRLASGADTQAQQDGNSNLKVKSSIHDENLVKEMVILREQMSKLTSQMLDLTSEKSDLTSRMLDLTSSLAHEVACREALEAKVEALYYINTISNTVIDTEREKANAFDAIASAPSFFQEELTSINIQPTPSQNAHPLQGGATNPPSSDKLTPPFVAETTPCRLGENVQSSIQDESSTSVPTLTSTKNSEESHASIPTSEIVSNDTMLVGFASTQEIEASEVSSVTGGNVRKVSAASVVIVEKPAIPVMPPATMKWSVEKLVQITEAKRIVKGKTGAYFDDKIVSSSTKSQRQRQLDAAKAIVARKITEQQYVAAYDDVNDVWWNENKGSVTVETMAANTPRKIMRVVEITEKLETRSEATGKSDAAATSKFTPRIVSSAPQRPNKTAYTNEEIMKLRRMTAEEVKVFHAQRRAERELLSVGK